MELPAVLTVDKLPVSERCIPRSKDIDEWTHLEGVEIPEISGIHEVTLLIGNDAPEVFWVLEEKRGKRKEPYAVKSVLGWTVVGPTAGTARKHEFSVNYVRSEDVFLQEQLEKI